MAKEVILKENRHDRQTGREYRAGVYEVAERSVRRDQMDASFAARVTELGVAEDLGGLDEKNKAELEDLADLKGVSRSGDENKDDLKAALKK